MPTISEIQNYIKRHQKPEDDEIPDKAKDRVTRQIAESVKGNEELPQGRCNICAREDDKLVPATMTICMTCCGKFMKRGGQLRIIKKEVKDYHCDFCLSRAFTHFYVNPLVCIPCTKKIGRTHKYQNQDATKERIKIDRWKKENLTGGETQ